MQSTNNQTPLADGSQLNQYKLIRQLGKGGFGITYLVLDESLNKLVALKEYFPDALSFRTREQMHVSVLSADKQNDFTEGLRRFEREAMMLSEFKHPNIIQVLALFKENNTAYFAMDYIEGLSLDDYQKEKNRALTEQEIIKQCLPVLNGLKEVHNKDMLHLDIKPDNIIQTKYGQPILIDFGGARVQTSKKSQVLSQHSSMVATEGYAPTEQYSLIAEQTPATDLYAFGMTLYKLMAPEHVLPKSNDRKDQVFDDLPDPLKPIRQAAPDYSDELYQAVEACTQLKQKDRPQTVAQLQRILEPLYSMNKKAEPNRTEKASFKHSQADSVSNYEGESLNQSNTDTIIFDCKDSSGNLVQISDRVVVCPFIQAEFSRPLWHANSSPSFQTYPWGNMHHVCGISDWRWINKGDLLTELNINVRAGSWFLEKFMKVPIKSPVSGLIINPTVGIDHSGGRGMFHESLHYINTTILVSVNEHIPDDASFMYNDFCDFCQENRHLFLKPSYSWDTAEELNKTIERQRNAPVRVFSLVNDFGKEFFEEALRKIGK